MGTPSPGWRKTDEEIVAATISFYEALGETPDVNYLRERIIRRQPEHDPGVMGVTTSDDSGVW